MNRRGAKPRAATWTARLRARVHRMAAGRLGTGSAILRRLGVAVEPITDSSHAGLIVIQVDGLSAPRMRRALARRAMPFLSRQVRNHRYTLQPYLSQVPTSTPAFQAGCFYGTNEGIPGFQFYDKRCRKRYKMGHTSSAREVQESLPGPGLLQGGSVYSCVFDGGAAGSLFIFSSLLNPRRWRFALRLWDLFILTLLHIRLVLRILALAALELILAIAEFPLWLRESGRLRLELELICIRVGLLIIGREMITLNTIMDIERGVPIVYTNYLGYDECAHIRGPDSATARLQLRAIDRCIRRIHRATLHGDRLYQILLLSDHGQAACIPFAQVTGKPVGPWLQEVLTTNAARATQARIRAEPAVVTNPVVVADRINDREAAMAEDQAAALRRILPGYPPVLRKPVDRVASALESRFDSDIQPPPPEEGLVVSISGPTAHIYWAAIPDALDEPRLAELYPGLIEDIMACDAIGCVSLRGKVPGEVLIRARDGEARIQSDGTKTITGNLPPDRTANPSHAYDGIRRVTLMDRSGDLILWGGGAPAGQISFVNERGCHTGFSDGETQGFVLAPAGCPVDFSGFTRHAEFYDALLSLRPPLASAAPGTPAP